MVDARAGGTTSAHHAATTELAFETVLYQLLNQCIRLVQE